MPPPSPHSHPHPVHTPSRPLPACSAEDLERLVEEAEAHRAEDEDIKKKAEARSSLENYLYR